MKVVFATNNQNKIHEVKEFLPKSFELLGLEDIGFQGKIEETGSTLEENSLLKAKTVFEFCGIATIADDTGLEVEALGGAPGVYSARFAGSNCSSRDNINKLLLLLQNKTNRNARFTTIFTFMDKDKIEQFEGSVEGEIASGIIGEQGFGYDPVFIPKGQALTFGQMTLEEKNKYSHRARSLQKLIDFLITQCF
jgi:XTP/dITP diphosphohydrolase